MSYDFTSTMQRIQAATGRACELCGESPHGVLEIDTPRGGREILLCADCTQKVCAGDAAAVVKSKVIVSQPGRAAEVQW